MKYILTVVHATTNAGSVTEDLTFEYFYDMQDFILEKCDGWESYHINVSAEV